MAVTILPPNFKFCWRIYSMNVNFKHGERNEVTVLPSYLSLIAWWRLFVNRVRSFFTRPPKFVTLALGTKPKPLPIPELPKRKRMQTPNNSTITRYQGVVERLLIETHCVEISEITVEALRQWVKQHTTNPEQCERAPFLLSRLLSLWTGAAQVSQELHSLLVEIAWPAEKEKLLTFFGGKFDTETRDRMIDQLKWRFTPTL